MRAKTYLLRVITVFFLVGITSCQFSKSSTSTPLSPISSSPTKTAVENSSQPKNQIYFTSELWPGEGIPQFKAKKVLRIFQQPSTQSEIVENAQIQIGEEIAYTNTQFQTIEPVSVQLENNLSIEVRDYGVRSYLSKEDYYDSGSDIQLELNAGDTIKVLQPRAEGTFFFEANGRVYAGECSFCLSISPNVEWWVETSLGGWVKIDEGSVEFLPRLF